jgi:23S rRNA pseudouridine2605 synthase
MKNTERPQRPRKDTKDKSFSTGADKRSDKKSFSDDSRPRSEKKSPSFARPKGNFPKKDGFERSFNEPRFGERRPFGDKKPFTTEPSERPFEKKAARPYGEKKSFDRPERPFAKREEGGFDKKRSFDDKKPFAKDRSERPFVKREEGGFDKKRSFEDKKPFAKDRSERPFVKREEGGFDKKRSFEDKKPFAKDRPERPFARREEGGFDKKRSFEDKKPFAKDRSDRPFANRKEGGFEEKRSFEKDKPRFDRREDKREERGFAKNAKADKRENQANSSQVSAPNYNLEKMKSSLPARVQKKVALEEKDSDGLIRLNRYISNAGIASRRDADELIASGQITVNGKTIIEMGYKVKPSDVVKYGKKLLNREKLVYILLNKPKDFITTTEDPNERKTVMDLVANACEERVYPVGRLDRNTTGLLLLTNDGELAEKLSHPSNEIRKIYQVELDKPITTEHFEAIKTGVELEDGFIKADDLGLVTPDAEVVGIEIHSGKNRIVRRIFEHFGYEVMKLDRTTYAGLNKKDLPRGKWRFLTEKEVIRLKYMI